MTDDPRGHDRYRQQVQGESQSPDNIEDRFVQLDLIPEAGAPDVARQSIWLLQVLAFAAVTALAITLMAAVSLYVQSRDLSEQTRDMARQGLERQAENRELLSHLTAVEELSDTEQLRLLAEALSVVDPKARDELAEHLKRLIEWETEQLPAGPPGPTTERNP